MFFHVTSSLLTFARVHVHLGNLLKWRICIVWEKRVFCLAYIQRRLFVFVLLCFTHSHESGMSANVRGNISVPCLCVLRDRAFRSPASVSAEASLPWLLFRYFCTSRDTRDVCMCWCHTAVSLETAQPCLFHHSFVHPAGLYPCLENSEKPQLRDCIRFSSVSPVRAFACLRRHVGCDSTCLWCRRPSVT